MSARLLHLDSTAEALSWLRQQGVTSLTVDSRQVPGMAAQGVGFVAWPGAARDGRAFVSQALAKGARACLVEAEGAESFAFADPRIAAVPGLKARSAEIAHGFHGEPSAQLQVVAVTGTNGKTSTSWWTAQALSALGQGCGVIGTLGVGQAGAALTPTGLTTPDPITVHGTFRQFVDQGLKAAAIEASSIGLEELRLHATHIAVAQFTNFTQDHLDYHGSMAAYWQAKRALFDWPGLKAAVINVDDPMGVKLEAQARARGLAVWTYSVADVGTGAKGGATRMARLQAEQVRHEPRGLAFTVLEHSDSLAQIIDQAEVRSTVIGTFNVSNLMAVLGALRALGHTLAQAAQACSGLQAVPGRMQMVQTQRLGPAQAQPLAVVDYAHTPDALQKALEALRPVARVRGGQLWCVFGCGGNRDPIKRPLMGAMAQAHADHVVLTSDNPRDENPQTILAQIQAGMPAGKPCDVIVHRRDAIAHALHRADARDVVLVAGKGHETHQEVAGVKTPFSDVDVALSALDARVTRSACADDKPHKPAMMTLGLAHALLPGSVLHGDPATPLMRVHTDTRSLQAGDFFVALRGEHFDAHDFLPQAAQAGAMAVMAQRGIDSSGLPGLPGLTVPDTRAALSRLASGWRARFDIPLIGVTGSNGKTTVTQMLASVLRAWVLEQGAPEASLATQGNFNNDIGVPLTLLRLREGVHRCAVVELGMNHPGEIAELAAVAAPTVGLVNNAQREHQEFMHTVEAVARENGAVLTWLTRSGTAVFPADDEHTPIWRELAHGRKQVTFAPFVQAAHADQAAVTGTATWVAEPAPHWRIKLNTTAGSADVQLHMAGQHNVRNALAAGAAAMGAGVPLSAIVAGLNAFEPVKGRSQLHRITLGGRAVTLVDDSYNANPDSVRAAIDMLADLPGPQWLVLGDMGEVGSQGPAFHAEVGAYARERGIAGFWAVGSLCSDAAKAYGASAVHYQNAQEVVDALSSANQVPAAASVLIKGSRFMKMEQIVASLLGALRGGGHAR